MPPLTLCDCVTRAHDPPQSKKYNLTNTYSNYSSILTYNETGYTDFSHLLDVYEEAASGMNIEAGRLLAENLQDQSARSGLALAGWNPKHSDMAAQAVDYWSWGRCTSKIRYGGC